MKTNRSGIWATVIVALVVGGTVGGVRKGLVGRAGGGAVPPGCGGDTSLEVGVMTSAVTSSVPSATGVSITIAGNKATGTYTYVAGGDGLAESGTTKVIQRALDANGSSATTVETTASHTLATTDSYRYLRFCVTPTNAITTGSQACSAWSYVGPLFQMYTNTGTSTSNFTITGLGSIMSAIIPSLSLLNFNTIEIGSGTASSTAYTGTNVNIAWEKSAWGTCINLSDYGMATTLDGWRFQGYETGPVTMWMYTGKDCTGTSGTWTNSVPGGEWDVPFLNSTWYGKTASMKFTWTESTSTYFKFVNRNSSQCMDVRDNSTQPKAYIQQYDCNGTSAQGFKLVPDGYGLYSLVGQNSGYCVDVLNNSTSNDSTIQIWPCNGTTAQKFYLASFIDGVNWWIIGANSGKCLQVSGSSTTRTAQVLLEPCSTTTTSQHWTISGL